MSSFQPRKRKTKNYETSAPPPEYEKKCVDINDKKHGVLVVDIILNQLIRIFMLNQTPKLKNQLKF